MFSPPPQTPLQGEFIQPLGSILNALTLSLETLLSGPPGLTDPPGMFTPLIPHDQGSFPSTAVMREKVEEVVEDLSHTRPLGPAVYRAAVYPAGVWYRARRVLNGDGVRAYDAWYQLGKEVVQAELERLDKAYAKRFQRLNEIVEEELRMLEPRADALDELRIGRIRDERLLALHEEAQGLKEVMYTWRKQEEE